MELEAKFFAFFKKLSPAPKKILLGLSGGPDSIAALYLLLELQRKGAFELGIAHVDHGWREESGLEAETLRNLANTLNLPFFLKVLKPKQLKGNLEEASRQERLNFFSNLCETEGFDALVLAHHAKDQAETILKRIFEGAKLLALRGMDEVKSYNHLKILRPLLNCSKEEILDYLEKRQISFFLDPTNQEVRFLRGKMRQELFPLIESSFGKKIQNPLCNIGEDLRELRGYMDSRLSALCFVSGPLGSFVDLRALHLFEIKWFLNDWFKSKEISLSRSQLNTFAKLIEAKKANKRIDIKNLNVFIDRGYFFHLNEEKINSTKAIPLEIGEHCFGPWKISVRSSDGCEMPLLGWKQIMAGNCLSIVQKGKYWIKIPEGKDFFFLKRSRSGQKVPAFLSKEIPIIANEEGIFLDFLIENPKKIMHSSSEKYAVSLYRE